MSTKAFYFARRTHEKCLIFCLSCGLSVAALACSRETTEPPPPAPTEATTPAKLAPAAPAGPAELALVAPLVVGGSLGDFQVREIQAVRKGVLNVICAKDRSVVRLSIALASEKGPEPPAEAGKYAVFYSLRRGSDPSEAERLAKALAEIVAKHSDVPVPQGMTEFVPAAIPM
jgi:hypothetical protein